MTADRINLREYIPVLDLPTNVMLGWLPRILVPTNWKGYHSFPLAVSNTPTLVKGVAPPAEQAIFSHMIVGGSRDERRFGVDVLTVNNSRLVYKIPGFVSFAEALGEEIP